MFGSFKWCVPIFVALSTFGGVNGILFTSARLFFIGAEESQLPKVFAFIHHKRMTPVPSLLFTVLKNNNDKNSEVKFFSIPSPPGK